MPKMVYPIIDRMSTQLAGWQDTADQRSVFLQCYTLMTRNMLVAVDAGTFHDGVWVSTLLHRFADYYFRALDSFTLHASTTPRVWRHAFEMAQQPRIHSLQHLFLGVNAHIRYDLVLTLNDMLCGEWPELSEVQRQQRYADHSQVNRIIYETVNAVQDGVIEKLNPEMDIVDTLMGGLDEWLIYKLISRWRDQVWQQAHDMIACTADSDRTRVIYAVEERVMQHAEAMLGQHGIRGLAELL
jgi:hypothetical protein